MMRSMSVSGDGQNLAEAWTKPMRCPSGSETAKPSIVSLPLFVVNLTLEFVDVSMGMWLASKYSLIALALSVAKTISAKRLAGAGPSGVVSVNDCFDHNNIAMGSEDLSLIT